MLIKTSNLHQGGIYNVKTVRDRVVIRVLEQEENCKRYLLPDTAKENRVRVKSSPLVRVLWMTGNALHWMMLKP